MIPLRIRLKGFLSYRDEQVIEFDDAPLWVLGGPNGSGKSSVFDAITYALFGAHRGGKSGDVDLIHKQADRLEVVFEFRVDSDTYRIHRTYSRPRGSARSGRSTRNAYRRDPSGNWQPLPDTESDKGFDKWIESVLGFDHDTFTSSVLLLQGQAEKLLDSTPEGRRKVLNHAVGIERYERLAEIAKDRLRRVERECEATLQQLEMVPPDLEEQLAAVTARRQELENTRDEHQRNLTQLEELRRQAERAAELRQKLDDKQRQLRHIQQLLAQAAAIENRYRRWQQLNIVLPHVERILTEKGQIAESGHKRRQLEQQLQEVDIKLRQLQNQIGKNESKLAVLRELQDKDQSQYETVQQSLRQLAPRIGIVDQLEKLDGQIREWERQLAAFPPDLQERLAAAEAELARLRQLGQDYPHLEQLHEQRSKLRQALNERHLLQQDLQQLSGELDAAQKRLQWVQQQLEAARAAYDQAQREHAAAESRASDARRRLDEFQKLQGQPTCSACGQPLTPEHYAAEQQRREQAALQAENAACQLAEAWQQAKQHLQSLETQEKLLRQQRDTLQQKRLTLTSRLDALERQIPDSQLACRKAYLNLSEASQRRVAMPEPPRWEDTAYPDREELHALTQECRRSPQQEKTVAQLRQQMQEQEKLHDRLQNERQRSGELRAQLQPHSPDEVRSQYHQLQAQERTLKTDLDTRKLLLQAAEKHREDLRQQESRIQQQRLQCESDIRLEDERVRTSSETIEREKRLLPPEWQLQLENMGLSDWNRWKQEREDLEAANIQDQYQQLQNARLQHDQLQADCDCLQSQIDAIPPAARQPLAQIDAELNTCGESLRDIERQYTAVRAEELNLQRQQKVAAELQQRLKDLRRLESRWKRLHELLGKERLQRHLIRRAERQIVDYANAILDRISGGTMRLQLKGTDAAANSDKALDLECFCRHAEGGPINVKFLSGSQKFRVAVALALGIGHYVSHRHQPIESVIIDEGFGSLDREGRQVMIQELQNLRGCLKCIVLVSHQEEFAEAFPNGYRFELRDGTTHVHRLQP